MTLAIATLAEVREQLGVARLVAHLAEQDPATSLSAIAESLEQFDLDRLRSSLGKTRRLAQVLEQVEADDLVDLDLELRVDALDRARAQIRRIVLVTSREVGRRFAVLPADRGGRAEAPRRSLRERLRLRPYAARQYARLAEVDDVGFARVLELAAREEVSIATAIRHAASAGEHSGSGWSTPLEILDAVREVLGEIHLDVASHLGAQACTVRARRWYSAETPTIDAAALAWARTFGLDRAALERALAAHGGVDGLADGNPWALPGERWPTLYGNVPFDRTICVSFCERLVREVALHPRLAAVWLLNLDPSRDDQQALFALGLHCQIGARVAFLSPVSGVAEHGNRAAQVAIGVGGGLDRDRFRVAFGRLGPVYQPSTAAASIAHVRELAEAHDLARLGQQLDKLAAALV